jgi:DNA-binding transcriptional MerR regulator
MMTVSKFASLCGVSRTTVLYYESQGLLKPELRTGSNYRVYGEREVSALRQIRLYRSMGMSVREIRSVLTGRDNEVASALKRRLAEVDEEIEILRGHQKAILRLLQNKSVQRSRGTKMTKDKWVAVMKAAGFKEEDMHRWHREFERSAPDDHQEFLQFLHIPEKEIMSIREWSRKN